MEELIIRFPCPLHYGLRFHLECVDCMGMPAVRSDGTLIDSPKAITTEHQRRWARQIFAEREARKRRQDEDEDYANTPHPSAYYERTER